MVGPSGCGKSTFLLMVAGLERLSQGRLLIEGKPVNGPDHRRALVFQEYHLFPWKGDDESAARADHHGRPYRPAAPPDSRNAVVRRVPRL
ncbi:MAG: ATP-binding cassette domain-containing protein [Deltaproteobacteria bacterium]|nr:ATP-binding cassette domain-containing protein [Deltaproteobacteria bacterium]